jgi:glycerol-3-phosphate dehydrogenase
MKVITGNRLQDGAAVFLSPDGWETDIARAAVLNATDAVEAGLASAARAVVERKVVDVTVIDVELDDSHTPVPLRLRERIRAFGPTVRYGEQARQRLVA